MSLEIAIIGGLIGASFVFIYLASILDKSKYGVLQVLLMFLSLIFITVSMSVSSAFLRIQAQCTTCSASVPSYNSLANTLDVLYSIMLYTVIFILLIFVLVIIITTFRKLWLRIENQKGFKGD